MKQALQKALPAALGMLAAGITLLFADGGTVQFRKQAGALIITAFSTPMPVRVGATDFSVMVQRARDQGAVLDADVKLRLVKSTPDKVLEIMMPATRAQATNKMLYACEMKVPSAGEWRLEVQVTAEGQSVNASNTISVLPAEPPAMAHWPYFALIPAAILAFALNQWLKSKRGLRYRQARP